MKTKEEILKDFPRQLDEFGQAWLTKAYVLIAMEDYASQPKWISVDENNMPLFYENYLLSINGTTQHITYQFVGKEVDEVWVTDEADPAYWFQAEYEGGIYQVLIDDGVFYQPLPENPTPPTK